MGRVSDDFDRPKTVSGDLYNVDRLCSVLGVAESSNKIGSGLEITAESTQTKNSPIGNGNTSIVSRKAGSHHMVGHRLAYRSTMNHSNRLVESGVSRLESEGSRIFFTTLLLYAFTTFLWLLTHEIYQLRLQERWYILYGN